MSLSKTHRHPVQQRYRVKHTSTNFLRQNKRKSKLVKTERPAEMVYFITKDLNNETYFAAATKDSDSTVVWTTQRKKALEFQTESAVRYYIVNRMNARTDVHVTGYLKDKEE